MKYILAVFISISFIRVNATTPEYLDSVKQVLKTSKNNSEILACLYTLSFEYGLIQPSLGIDYGKKCLNLAASEKNLNYKLNAYNGIANAYETLGSYDSARYFHSKSYEIAEEMNNSSLKALTLINVGLCLKQLGNYSKALEYYLKGYRILEKQETYNPRIHFYLGEIYLKMGDYTNAESQSRLGIIKCKQFNHNYINYNLYINLAKCYLHKKQYDVALNILTPALDSLKKHTDQTSIGICLNAIGETYMLKKNHSAALEAFEKELAIHVETKNMNGIVSSHVNIALAASNIARKKNDFIKKHLIATESILNTTQKNTDLLSEVYFKLAQTNELIGEDSRALDYYKSFYQLEDSILNKEKFSQLNELQTKYETEKKENEISALKQSDKIKSLEIKKRNTIIYLVISLSLFSIALGILFIQRQKLKNKLEKQLTIKTTEESERMRIAKDIHDDLGSGLSKINFLSELIKKDKNLNPNSSENVEAISETAQKLVLNMKDLIWALNPENTSLQGLTARIREHSADYLEDFAAELILDFPKTINQLPITKESHRQILMTVKEALNNIVKHSKATLIEISITISEISLTCKIKDNGIGINNKTNQGNGMNNMNTRITSIGGKFTVNSKPNEGTIILFVIPIKSMLRN